MSWVWIYAFITSKFFFWQVSTYLNLLLMIFKKKSDYVFLFFFVVVFGVFFCYGVMLPFMGYAFQIVFKRYMKRFVKVRQCQK